MDKFLSLAGSSNEAVEKDTILLLQTDSYLHQPEKIAELTKALTYLNYDVQLVSINNSAIQPILEQIVNTVPRAFLDIFGIEDKTISFAKLTALIITYRKINRLSLILLDDMSFICPLTHLFRSIVIICIDDMLNQIPLPAHSILRTNVLNQNYSNKLIVRCTNVGQLRNMQYDFGNISFFFESEIERPNLFTLNAVTASNVYEILNKACKIILCFGRYNYKSNIELAINSFLRLLKYCHVFNGVYNMKLIICGTSRNNFDKQYLESLIDNNSDFQNHIIFLNNIFDEITARLIQSATCVLFTSELVVIEERKWMIEALKNATIIIAPECPLVLELVIHDINGYVCDLNEQCFLNYLKKIMLRNKHLAITNTVSVSEDQIKCHGIESIIYKFLESIQISDGYSSQIFNILEDTIKYTQKDSRRLPETIEFDAKVIVNIDFSKVDTSLCDSAIDNQSEPLSKINSSTERSASVATLISALSDEEFTEYSSMDSEDIRRYCSLINLKEIQTWKFKRTRSYSLPRNWRPLEN